MKKDSKKTFKERQIEIFKAEQKLANDTQKLLFDLLEHLTEEQRAKFEGHAIDDYEEIVSINKDGYISKNEIDEENNYLLEVLNQSKQKELIDTILLEILGM